MRRRTAIIAAVVAAALCTVMAGPADAARALSSTVLLTSERPLDIPNPDAVEPYTGFNQGWYSVYAGHDTDGYDNPNYTTGWCCDDDNELRSFFAFWAPSAGGKVLSASLVIPRGRCQNAATVDVQQGVDPVETLQLSAVRTDTTALVRGSTDAFADLGDGAVYGTADVSTVQGPSMSAEVTIPLNARAVRDLNKARNQGRYFAVGGALTSIDRSDPYGNESIFGCTGALPARLAITTAVH